MKRSTVDLIKGKANEAVGGTKQKVGRGTGDPVLASRGADQKAAGKVQKKVGQIKKVFNA